MMSALTPMAANAQLYNSSGVGPPVLYPAQYHGPSFFQGSSGPVVVPPTVITPPAAPHCRSKSISFLLIFEMDVRGCG